MPQATSIHRADRAQLELLFADTVKSCPMWSQPRHQVGNDRDPGVSG